jgi:hypothetical protein
MHIMTNIIILTMLISTVYNFLFRRKSYALNCGIFAWAGEKPEQFNPFLFNVLGVYNDSRGGDSCGVYFNRSYIKGIGATARYANLVREKHLHNTIKLGKTSVVIGHTRKASVGAVSMDNTQPVVIMDSKNKMCYVQAHNGTLSNHRELANKHKIDTSVGETDSSILAKLIYKLGFKILKEYEGTAALVMHSPKETNVIYAFHGKSTKWSYVPSEERPLHYMSNPEFGTYISSEKDPLEFIGNGDNEVLEFKYNVLYRVEGSSVTEVEVINRAEEKPKTTPTAIGFNKNRNYELEWSGKSYGKNICSIEIGRTSGSEADNVIRYTNGFFYVGKKIAHGYYNVDNWGFICMAFNNNAADRYHLWFFCGVLMTCTEGFKALIDICTHKKINIATAMCAYDDVKHLEKALKEYAVYPYTRSTTTQTGVMMPSDIIPSDERSGSFFSGIFTPLFSDLDLYFSNGDIVGKSKTTNKGMYTITELLSDYTDLYLHGFGEPDPKKETSSLPQTTLKEESLIEMNIKNVTCTSDYPTDCDKYGNFDGSCDTCSYNRSFTPDREEHIMLIHTISAQLIPIVKDLEHVIDEIESSGYQDTVKQELVGIIKAKDNLKTILS